MENIMNKSLRVIKEELIDTTDTEELKSYLNYEESHKDRVGMKEYLLRNTTDIEELKLHLNYEESHQNRPRMIEFIQRRINPPVNKKKTNKKREGIRIKSICDHINGRTPLGIRLMEEYFSKFDKEILTVETYGGLNTHYDFIVKHTDGTLKKIEEKGTDTYYESISVLSNPWENSVQFSNIPASEFTVADHYLRLWYGENVDNETIRAKYDLPEIPTYEEFLGGCAYCMVNPSHPFFICLKDNYRGLYPGYSMNGYQGHNQIDYREKVNEAFHMTDEMKQTLIQEIQPIYNKAMTEKEGWLQTTGDITTEFSFRWYEQIMPQKIVTVELIKGKDIKFKFILDDGTHIMGILRWGNGCGFSCFRIDLK